MAKITLVMQFLTDSNKKVRIAIPNPKQPVDNAAVEHAMDLIVQKGIFAFPQGKIVKKIGATLTESSSTDVG
jgi:hypothetical protein